MVTRYGQGNFYHSVVVHGDTLYLSGVIADDLSAPMGEQTRQVLEKITRTLGERGSSVHNILSATVYLADFSGKEAMNAVWAEWFQPADLPARTTVGVATLGKGVLIEVSVTAAK